MIRRIDLLDEQHKVTVIGRPKERQLKVDEEDFEPVSLTVVRNEEHIVHLGDQSVRVKMAIKGETAYIQAFDRTFTLTIVNPVEQAAQSAGNSSNTIRSPMPGTVVSVAVAGGDPITKGQPMITIESMKILTVITAPRSGEVSEIHYQPQETFDKNAVLITLLAKEEA